MLVFSLSFWLFLLPLSSYGDETAQPKYTLTSKAFKEFQGYIDILNKEKPDSKKYKKAINFLETSFYKNSSFETLATLADLYKKKKDYQNEIKVLQILVSDYSDIHLSHYKLGVANKHRYLEGKKNKIPHEEVKEFKMEAIDNLSTTIKQKNTYEEAYLELLPLLKKEDTHTHNSLSLIMDMIRHIKKPVYYTELCEAYYETNYLKQSRKACKVAIKKQPENPKNHFLYALSKEKNKDIKEQVIAVAQKYPNSFYVQYKTGEFFEKQNISLSTSYYRQALKIDPDSEKLNIMFAHLSFQNDQFKQAYKYFLKACLLTQGRFLPEFKKAKSRLTRKNKQMQPLFQKGIDKCISKMKK